MSQRERPKGRGTSDRTKYGYLLDDPDIRRWYQNVARGSKITADVYLRRLGNFRNETGLSPKDLTALPDKLLGDKLLDYISEREAGSAPTYLGGIVRAVKSWLAFNGKQLTRQLKIHAANNRPTVENEQVPTQDELRRIILSASIRDRISVVLMAHSGLRPQVMGSYMGDDGLRLRDLPELKVSGSEVSFEKTPALVRVPASLSKAGFQYLTFLSDEGCGYLEEYLESRIRSGEKLTPESPVITAKLPRKPFISSINVSDSVRKPIRAAGFSWRPYVLRAYFDTQLLLAESKGKLAHDYRVFWMGHTGSMEARYTTNKNRLPVDMIEDMRAAYKRCSRFLETRVTEPSENDAKTYLQTQLLLAVGYRQEEIDKLDLATMTDEGFQKILRDKVTGTMANNGHKQRVVRVDEVGRFINEGYEFVASLPDGTAVVKLPF